MRWQRLTFYAVLLAAWAIFASWQYRSYRQQSGLIEEMLHQQSHSVMNALIGGIRSHRRLGHFFQMQLQGMLDELVKSQDVLAVSIYTKGGQHVLCAGRTELLDASSPTAPGDYWESSGFRLVEAFSLEPPMPGPPGHGSRGGGMGWGHAQHVADDPRDAEGPFAAGGSFTAMLLLDRTRCEALRTRSGWSHLFVTLAAGLVLLCLALAWRASVGLVEAQGRARVLEIETRHLRELSQAAAGLAHETRNPLGLIRGWTQRLAEMDVNDAERNRHTQTMIEECDRVTARINQFLAFARPCDPHLASIDVGEVIGELAAILQPDLEAKDLTLERQGVVPPPTLHVDRELLRQALFNLLQNAIQFSPVGDRVTIAVQAAVNLCYRIDVADRGPGVPKDTVPSLFTPYYTTRPDGTGLGLAIVRRIAAAHGWQAVYEPRPDGGAVFSLLDIHG
jgi:signal transduction histidine kinase